MKKVVVFNFILTAMIVPQLVVAGGGPAVEINSLAPDQIANTNTENSTIRNATATESVSENQVSENIKNKPSLFAFFPAASERRAMSSVISAIALFGSVVLVAGVAFFAYKYYRKTQEINQMLGIHADGSDLDETTKTE